jgi:hypothetical protein
VGRRVVVQAKGQPAIRATHDKTLEITGDPLVSQRATCVVGVAAVFDPDALALLRNRVRVTVAAGGFSASGEAVVNPTHVIGDRIVIRRSNFRDADTLAVDSTLVASDLDPALVAALARPDTAVTVTVEEVGTRRPLVLVGAGEGRRAVLWRHADGDGIVAAPDPSAPWLADAARRGARFAGRTPAESALLAAGLPVEPAIQLGRVDRRTARAPEIAGLLASAPVPVVCTVPVEDAADVLGALPATSVAVEEDPMDVGVAVRWTTVADAIAAIAGFPGGSPFVVLPASRSGTGYADLDAVVRLLAAAGVPPRTVSEALGPLGVRRRAVYDALGESP